VVPLTNRLSSAGAVAFLAAGVLVAAPRAQVFRSVADVVRVPVIVAQRDGTPARGLRIGDFEIRENGRVQRIAYFSEGAPGEVLPLHLGLLLDTSESMERDLPDAMKAAIRFVNAVDESVDVTLVQFDSTISVGRFTPANYPLLFERIRGHRASGMTALYDAVAVYLQDALDQDGQHVLIMHTDGGDSSSTIDMSQLIDLLRLSSNVIVYPIGYLEHQSSTVRIQQQMRLSQIAQESGGQAFFPGSVKEIDAIYDKILHELTSRYTLGYVSSDPAADGRFRKLEVKVLTGKGLETRARSGYFAPRQR
jgi:VWFA-related protein